MVIVIAGPFLMSDAFGSFRFRMGVFGGLTTAAVTWICLYELFLKKVDPFAHISRQTQENKLKLLAQLNRLQQPSAIYNFFFEDEINRKKFERQSRVIAQLGAEHLSADEALQGSYSSDAMKLIIRTLRENSPIKSLLKRSQQDLFQPGLFSWLKARLQGHESLVKEEIEKKKTNFSTEILTAPVDTQWVMPCGLKAEQSGVCHASIFHFVKKMDGKFNLKLFDSGYCLQFHVQEPIGEKRYYCSYVKINDIKAERLLFLYEKVKEMEFEYAYHNTPNTSGMETLHRNLLTWTQGVRVTPPKRQKNPRSYTKGQSGGSCAASSLMVFLKKQMTQDEYRQFKLELRLNLLIKTFRIIRHGYNTFMGRLICLEIIQKLKKSWVELPEPIAVCEREIRKLEDQANGGSFFIALGRKIQNLFERFFAWWTVSRRFTLQEGSLDELFIYRQHIIAKDKDSIESLYQRLKNVSIKPGDEERFIAVSSYIIRFLKNNYAPNPEDINLSAGICYLIYKNLCTLPEDQRLKYRQLIDYCWSRILPCFNELQGGSGPWQVDITAWLYRRRNPLGV